MAQCKDAKDICGEGWFSDCWMPANPFGENLFAKLVWGFLGLLIIRGKCVKCAPDCEGKECGGDGCGGYCGYCAYPKVCTDGLCICQPGCSGKQCGDDGCGGSCGVCKDCGTECVDGQCLFTACDGKGCGPDGCGGSCGECPDGYTCDPEKGKCYIHWCLPNCPNKNCGPDGCGGSCGECGEDYDCDNAGICQPDCPALCEGKCGPAGQDDECECGCPEDFYCHVNGKCYPCIKQGHCKDTECGPSPVEPQCGCGECTEEGSACVEGKCKTCDELCEGKCGQVAEGQCECSCPELFACDGGKCYPCDDYCTPGWCGKGGPSGECYCGCPELQGCQLLTEFTGQCKPCFELCAGRVCGTMGDGQCTCGPLDGECPEDAECNQWGVCFTCEQECANSGHECGSVMFGSVPCLCGDYGGDCEEGQTCTSELNELKCQPCMEYCVGKCGSSGDCYCGDCGEGFYCWESECLPCDPFCPDGKCGIAGPTQECNCGECTDEDTYCDGGTCKSCLEACEGKDCGTAGPSGECDCGNNCEAGLFCLPDGKCGVCEPDCLDKECGADGCGGSCGQCDPQFVCLNGQCIDLDAWLADHPQIAQALVWWIPLSVAAADIPPETPVNAGWVSYLDWPSSIKERFRLAVAESLLPTAPGIENPPPNVLNNFCKGSDNRFAASYENATDLFFSLSGLNLALELQHEQGWYPAWSLTSLGDFELRLLLDGTLTFLESGLLDLESLTGTHVPVDDAIYIEPSQLAIELVDFLAIRPTDVYALPASTTLPANGRFVYDFLNQTNILAESQSETIGNLLSWARRLQHTEQHQCTDTKLLFSYAGPAPLSRVLSGWDPEEGAGGLLDNNFCCPSSPPHCTTGCQMSSQIFRHVLRAANIPAVKLTVETKQDGRHGGDWFLSVGSILPHADEPYCPGGTADYDTNQWLRGVDYPGELLLLDEDEFFGLYEFDEVGICIPTGEQYLAPLLKDLHAGTAVDYLSPYVLYLFCQDWLASKDSGWPENSDDWPDVECENFDSFVLNYLGEDKLLELKQMPVFGPDGNDYYLSVVKTTLLGFMATWFPEDLECLNNPNANLNACLKNVRNWLQAFALWGQCGGLLTDYCATQDQICKCIDLGVCESDCQNKECGPDGCGGSCGSCAQGYGCVNGQCQCVPDCSDKQCGEPDGCGGKCQCSGEQDVCIEGACLCIPNCSGKECGSDGCDGSCGICSVGLGCEDGKCTCIPNCEGKECGSDGCDGSCGECQEGEVCDGGVCCEPDCEGKVCGDDGCGGSCGECGGDQFACYQGQCFCAPQCPLGVECGDDMCGGTCGECPDNHICKDGKCECQPDCKFKECGDDGCGGTCPGDCPEGYECQDNLCICVPDCEGKECGDSGCWESCGTCEDDGICVNGACIGPQSSWVCDLPTDLSEWTDEDVAWRALQVLAYCTFKFKWNQGTIFHLSVHEDGLHMSQCNEQGFALWMMVRTSFTGDWGWKMMSFGSYDGLDVNCGCALAYDELCAELVERFDGPDVAGNFLATLRSDGNKSFYFAA